VYNQSQRKRVHRAVLANAAVSRYTRFY
jgi:hypothetical protein